MYQVPAIKVWVIRHDFLSLIFWNANFSLPGAIVNSPTENVGMTAATCQGAENQ